MRRPEDATLAGMVTSFRRMVDVVAAARADPVMVAAVLVRLKAMTARISPTNATTELGLTDKNHACSCGTDDHTSAHSNAGEPGMVGTIREHYLVEGMTWSHCVSSGTEELSAVDGVESVGVDLKVGGASPITVVTSKPVPVGDVRTAITEGGYTLVTV
jgi:copper chaperone